MVRLQRSTFIKIVTHSAVMLRALDMVRIRKVKPYGTIK